MNKVITINLNGRAYQLEESGYEALRAYLSEAEARLEGDEGKTEIIADLEQAIAEKCDKVLSPHKSVVSDDEIQKIIAEMGPVEGTKTEGGAETGSSARTNSQSSAPKRLYLIREGAILAGVCTGLAAYFDVDVTIVRVIFAALTIITGGIWIAMYIALAFILPNADTGEARAAAHGQTFKAQDIVDRAKERFEESYERFTGTKYGSWDKNEWRKWKHDMKQQRREWRYAHRNPNPFLGWLSGALSLLWIFALLSLITTGAIFGWIIPAGIPIWVAIVVLFVVFHAVTGPMRGAASTHQWGPHGQYYGNSNVWEGLIGGITVLFLAIAFGWAYLHVPQVFDFVHHPIAETKAAFEYLKEVWKR